MRKVFFYLLSVLAISLSACEKEIEIEPSDGEEKLVVEGYIEPDLPPFVILTRSQPFFSRTDLNDLSEIFVRGAEIKVSNGADTVVLQEISSDSLPEALVDTLSERLGVDLATASDPEGLTIVIYTSYEMTGEIGGSYWLDIKAEGKHLASSTTIPQQSPLDSLWAIPHPENDTLFTLYTRYSDPPGERNFVRYFTSVNGQPFYPPYFNSVLDDRNLLNVDGKTFDFPLEKGHNRNGTVDFDTFTYFAKGDTIIVRWAAIDEAHFNFWSTAEFDRNSSGNPFSSPIIIKSNIFGGLGIWGGYSPSYHYLVME